MLERLKEVKAKSDAFWEAQQHIFIMDSNEYLRKQHKLYPHLVPAYRTVHRTVPRRIVFRAIRWVNPKRQFKLMNVNPKDYASMDPEELKRHIVGLNQYRAEALTISNRYDQMIALIEIGQTPYRIMWPEDKAMSWEEYMERAERLKSGTANWEHLIDDQANSLMKALEKHNIHLGSIDDLWEDDVMPFFKQPGSNYTKPLRQMRYSPGDDVQRTGGRKGKPAIPDDRYRTVSPLEIRPGEEFRGGEQAPMEDYERGFEVDPGVFPVVGNAIVGRTAFIPREDVAADKTVVRGPIFLRDEVNPEVYPVQQWRNNHLDKYLDREVQRFDFSDAEFLAKVRVHPFQPEEGDYKRKRGDPVKDTIQDVEREFADRAIEHEEEQRRGAADEGDIERVQKPFDYNAYIRRRRLFTNKNIKRDRFMDIDLNEFSEDELESIGEKILPDNERSQWGSMNPNQQRNFLDGLKNQITSAEGEGAEQIRERQEAEKPTLEALIESYRNDPEYAGVSEEDLRTMAIWEFRTSTDARLIEQLSIGTVGGIKTTYADKDEEDKKPKKRQPVRESLKASLSGEINTRYNQGLRPVIQESEQAPPRLMTDEEWVQEAEGTRVASDFAGLRSTKTRGETTPEVTEAITRANREAAGELTSDEARAWKASVNAASSYNYPINFNDWLNDYESKMDDINYLKNTAGGYHDKYFDEQVRRASYGEAPLPSAEDFVHFQRLQNISSQPRDSVGQQITASAFRNIKNMEDSFEKEEMWNQWHEILEQPSGKKAAMEALVAETDAKGVDAQEAGQMEEAVTGESPTATPEAGSAPTPTASRERRPRQPNISGKPRTAARTEGAVSKRGAYAMKLKNGVKVVPMETNEWRGKAEVHADTISRAFGLNNATSYSELLRLKDGTIGIGKAIPHVQGGSLSERSEEELNDIFSKDSSRKALYQMAVGSLAFSRHAPITSSDIALGDDAIYLPMAKGFNDGENDVMFSPESAIPDTGLQLDSEQYRGEVKQFVDETIPLIMDKMAGIMQDPNLGFSSAITDIDDMKNQMFDRAMKSITGNTDTSSVSYYYPEDGEELAPAPTTEAQPTAPPSEPLDAELDSIEAEGPSDSELDEIETEEAPSPEPRGAPAEEAPQTAQDYEDILRREGLSEVRPQQGGSVTGTTAQGSDTTQAPTPTEEAQPAPEETAPPTAPASEPGTITGPQRAAIYRLAQQFEDSDYDSFYELLEDNDIELDENLMEYLGDWNLSYGDMDEYLDAYEDNPENRFLV